MMVKFCELSADTISNYDAEMTNETQLVFVLIMILFNQPDCKLTLNNEY